MQQLLIASGNPGKVVEFRDLLAGSGWQVLSPQDAGLALNVDETGQTYAENARLKADAFWRASGLAALSDDSGLEVDALNGEPGALHHLLGWDGKDEAERIQLLLDAMKDVPEGKRSARYRAVIVVVLPDGRSIQAEGFCEGVITTSPAGSNGFGYDPVFYLPERGLTMAQLSPEEKNAISHRAIAAAALREQLQALA